MGDTVMVSPEVLSFPPLSASFADWTQLSALPHLLLQYLWWPLSSIHAQFVALFGAVPGLHYLVCT